jgi:hypothetical protein
VGGGGGGGSPEKVLGAGRRRSRAGRKRIGRRRHRQQGSSGGGGAVAACDGGGGAAVACGGGAAAACLGGQAAAAAGQGNPSYRVMSPVPVAKGYSVESSFCFFPGNRSVLRSGMGCNMKETMGQIHIPVRVSAQKPAKRSRNTSRAVSAIARKCSFTVKISEVTRGEFFWA